MNNKEFIQMYEDLLNCGYCECNELNCLGNNPPKKILNIMKEQQQEIERLNNIINKLERLVEDYAWNSYYFKCGNRYLKSEILNDIREIIELKGSDKE